MVLENLTKKVQEIVVHEIVGDREYSLYIQPAGVIEIDKSLVVVGLDSLKGKVEEYNSRRTPVHHVEGESFKEPLEDVDTLDTDGDKESEDEESVEEESGEPTTLPSAFICEICKAEFASERGLNSHMARTHNKE